MVIMKVCASDCVSYITFVVQIFKHRCVIDITFIYSKIHTAGVIQENICILLNIGLVDIGIDSPT